MPARRLTLSLLPDTFAICRLEAHEALPAWLPASEFCAAIRTEDELSICCVESAVPREVRTSRGWRGLKFMGPFDFSETGVIACVAAPLAEAGISISVLATYDTDYVFVRQDALDSALEALTAAGHRVIGRS
jgi:hypothetical protein